MKNKHEGLTLGKMLKKIAPRIGAQVTLEPDWNIVGQIIFKNGKKSFFRYNTLDINTVGAADISKDKDYANYFLKLQGYPIIPGSKTFYS
ncbi:MAG TPA: cyanophycin synthetase, partial [Candidatus Paceibacterota bacterium]|nr:cyanophycin synthetase [Candidatus Paceibacterota bacterium]